MVVKHHHGLDDTSLDLLAWIKQVQPSELRSVLDTGNVVGYTGKDP